MGSSCYPSPPSLSGYTWRAANQNDLPALEDLQRRANGRYLDRHARCDFHSILKPEPGHTSITLCAADAPSRLAAFASAIVYSVEDEHHGDLDGLVDPALQGRGLGSFLLQWTQTWARRLLSDLPGNRPSLLRITFADRRDAAIPLYERQGFRLAHAADTLQRDIHHPIPRSPLRDGLSLHPWSESHGSPVYEVYRDAFGTSRSAPLWPEAQWQKTMLQCQAFRPDLSFTVQHGGSPVGFLISWAGADENVGQQGAEGYIAQLGVSPDWRRHGLGRALLAEALRGFRMLAITNSEDS